MEADILYTEKPIFEHIIKLDCYKCDNVFFASSTKRIYNNLKFSVCCPFCLFEQFIPGDYRGKCHLLPVSHLGIYSCSAEHPLVCQNNTTPIKYCTAEA